MSAAYASAVGSLGLVELTCIPEALGFRQPLDARKAFIFEPPVFPSSTSQSYVPKHTYHPNTYSQGPSEKAQSYPPTWSSTPIVKTVKHEILTSLHSLNFTILINILLAGCLKARSWVRGGFITIPYLLCNCKPKNFPAPWMVPSIPPPNHKSYIPTNLPTFHLSCIPSRSISFCKKRMRASSSGKNHSSTSSSPVHLRVQYMFQQSDDVQIYTQRRQKCEISESAIANRGFESKTLFLF